MMATELLPCPFCGAGETLMHENKRTWSGMQTQTLISASVHHWCEVYDGMQSRRLEFVGRDVESAIKRWNKRI